MGDGQWRRRSALKILDPGDRGAGNEDAKLYQCSSFIIIVIVIVIVTSTKHSPACIISIIIIIIIRISEMGDQEEWLIVLDRIHANGLHNRRPRNCKTKNANIQPFHFLNSGMGC